MRLYTSLPVRHSFDNGMLIEGEVVEDDDQGPKQIEP